MYPVVSTNQSPWTLNKMRRPDVNRAPTADTDKRYHLGTDGTANDDKRDHLVHGEHRAIATTKPTSNETNTINNKSNHLGEPVGETNTTTCENQQYKQPPYVTNTARRDDKRDKPTLVDTLLNKRIINFQGCPTSSHYNRRQCTANTNDNKDYIQYIEPTSQNKLHNDKYEETLHRHEDHYETNPEY